MIILLDYKILFTSGACAIEEEHEVTLTGGSASDTHADYEYKARVIRYKMSGDFEDLPSMNTGRSSHACGLFTNIEGEIVSTVSPAGLEVPPTRAQVG